MAHGAEERSHRHAIQPRRDRAAADVRLCEHLGEIDGAAEQTPRREGHEQTRLLNFEQGANSDVHEQLWESGPARLSNQRKPQIASDMNEHVIMLKNRRVRQETK